MADIDPLEWGHTPIEDDVAALEGAQSELNISAEQFIRARKRAYTLWMAGQADENDMVIVMNDLRYFCRADLSTYNTDPRDHARLEGRREVFLRIQAHLELSEDDLLNIYHRQ